MSINRALHESLRGYMDRLYEHAALADELADALQEVLDTLDFRDDHPYLAGKCGAALTKYEETSE